MSTLASVRAVAARQTMAGDSLQRRIRSGMDLPDLPRRRRRPGSVWAVGLAKDEGDVIEATIRHLLAQEVDGLLVMDNGSSDDTVRLLRELASTDARVHVGTDRERAFYQGRKTTHLANVARRAGADWVIPFDSDEHWYAEGQTLGEFFATCPGDVTWCDIHEAYPTAERGRLSPGDGAEVQVERDAVGIPKVAFKPRGGRWLQEGNHGLVGWSGDRSPHLHLLHYQYRSLEQFASKVKRGTEGLDATVGIDPGVGQHWREQAALSPAGQAERWQALLDGVLEDHGERSRSPRAVVPDPTSWRSWDPQARLTPSRDDVAPS